MRRAAGSRRPPGDGQRSCLSFVATAYDRRSVARSATAILNTPLLSAGFFIRSLGRIRRFLHGPPIFARRQWLSFLPRSWLFTTSKCRAFSAPTFPCLSRRDGRSIPPPRRARGEMADALVSGCKKLIFSVLRIVSRPSFLGAYAKNNFCGFSRFGPILPQFGDNP